MREKVGKDAVRHRIKPGPDPECHSTALASASNRPAERSRGVPMTSPQEPAHASLTRAARDQSPQPMPPMMPEPKPRTESAARRLLTEHIITQVDKGTVELRNDGIVHILWKPRGTIEVADALAAMVGINEVCRGAEHPMLVDIATADGFSLDARSMFSTPCAASRIALLGSGPVARVVASFFLGVRAPCPGRFFTSRNEAINWLAQAD